MPSKQKTVFMCSECGYEALRWLGKCQCGAYNSFTEMKVAANAGRGFASAENWSTIGASRQAAVKLHDVASLTEQRVKTNIPELDRVFCGGLVPGSITLLGGEPGIGKSTLLLQLCKTVDFGGKPILYASGEESLAQIKLRAERLGTNESQSAARDSQLYVLSETNIKEIEESVNEIKPALLIIDSIQTMYLDDVSSAPGSVTQIRECAALLMRLAKSGGVTVVIVGHVTKEGAIAGPRVLEHMVDTVVYFEGERQVSYRIIRAVKNRFGATDEIGVFEMRADGLFGIQNPSEYMLMGRPMNTAGSVVTCGVSGTRPLLAEVQALVCYTSFPSPRRAATGLDYNRAVMLIAALEKKASFQLSNYDAYLNLAGGIKNAEPALDLAVAAAIASSYKNKYINPYTIVFGEVGLAGEVRAVSLADRRINEAAKLGFKECIIPQANLKGLKPPKDIRVMGVGSVGEMVEVLF
jgi:DNA repair protein RadA/Sms